MLFGRLLNALALLAILVNCGLAATLWIGSHAGRPKPVRTPAKQASVPPDRPVSLQGAARRGQSSAPIVILMFSDFQCPYSKTTVTTLLPSVEAKYVKTGLVELAFRHLPLEVIHTSAVGAAVASECAGEQQSFWEMHDAIFLNQRQLDRISFERRAMRLGLNLAQYRTCAANPATDARVRQDVERARELNITATPTFLIGVRGSGDSMIAAERLSGSLPITRLERAIDSLLRKAESAGRLSSSQPRQ